ncbi:penicillin-binding protein activator [Vibrio viridaestus]|uniref:Penicillin-binding protein activator LpoA n=1 Tax=Vibrio viridaestus TaxID=2487322 RepID=A0A3N9TFP7_9VIBR|nr:penicillin-binding protein activator [Vibrio viridaestus]RQW62959.1 YraN family protein [Vibrio viridaestus]
MKNQIRLSVTRTLAPVALAMSIAACTSNAPLSNTVDITQAPSYSVQSYLVKADSSQGSLQNDWLIMALKAAVQKGDDAQANLLLMRLSKASLSDSQNAEWQLAKAHLLMLRDQYETALKQFNFKPWWKLSDSQWLAFYQTKAQIHTQLGNWYDSAKALVHAYDLSPRDEKATLANQIWASLNHYSADEITELELDPNNEVLDGWVQLAIYVKTLNGSLSQLKNTLTKWLDENPNHPAAVYQPEAIASILSLKVSVPQHTALLLPISGKFSQQAQLIRDGFMFSMMNDDSRDPNATLTIIDTNGKSLDAIADQIDNSNIDFVVGPLIKENIVALKDIEKKRGRSLPMLALNIPDQIDPSSDTCYFALSPEQEASQAAKHLFREGFRYPLILVPNGSFGQRVSSAFDQEWSKYSKHKVSVANFGDNKQLQKDINTVFGLTSSQQNIAQMQSILGLKMESQPRSRRDIDAVYIVANSSELTLIKPFIEVAINPDTTPPKLFSSSRSNTGKKLYEDLSGVAYSDIPLLIEPNADIAKQLNALWPKESFPEKRLKAMGMDAYQLLKELPQMKAVKGYQSDGETGKLSIDDKCVVQRELSWGEHETL